MPEFISISGELCLPSCEKEYKAYGGGGGGGGGGSCGCGGIQIMILLGDFLQLPPVPIKWFQDAGHWVFECMNWTYVVRHIIELVQVHRQNDSDFVKYINEVAMGFISKEYQAFTKSLNDQQKTKEISLP